jgi:acyl-CoA reductase-like NAD-dependent aldehyde dehydrogenase
VEPTLFADADNTMTVAREEIFGPVVVAILFERDDDAISIANDSEYGLSGAVYSASPERATRVARRIRSGQVYVNSAGVCPVRPFGGFKQSGFGREGGKDGIGEYLETKLLAGLPATRARSNASGRATALGGHTEFVLRELD